MKRNLIRVILLGGVCGAFAESAAPVGYEPRPRARPAERVMALAVGVAESEEEDVYPQPRERVWKAPRPQPINDIAVRELPFGVNAVPVWYDWDLAGEGQIVGHCDSGLDTGNVATMHPDFRGRVTGVILGTNVASWTDYRGHGTYTAGSLAGNGAMSGGAIRGVAWKAHIYHQGMGYGYEDFPDDLAEMYQPAYDFGARVHSGSWAALAGGTYCELDEQVDLFVWRNQEFLPVLGAGNSASDGGAYSREILEFLEEIADFLEEVGFTYAPADFTADGRVDPRSVGTPASAKNVICAGACESERPTGHGSGDVYNATLFPLPPIRGDLQNSGNIDGAGIYRKGVAAFSGRGPTFDGRIKPDLLAPGAMTLSTASRMGGNYPGNPYYTYCWGTSMSTPYIAGCAALAREHLIKRAGITAPTAALVRATLINGAVSLAPGQFGTGFHLEVPYESPNNVEGWGVVDLAGSLYPRGAGNVFFDRIGDGKMTGDGNPANMDKWSCDFTITDTNVPFRATLAWADYPELRCLPIPGQLVNDYDLFVENLDDPAEFYYGNGMIGGDATNTAERVIIASPTTATYRVWVIAANILKPYRKVGAKVVSPGSLPALAVQGGFENTFGVVPQVSPASIAMNYEGGVTNLRVNAVGAWQLVSTNDWAAPILHAGFGVGEATLHVATNYAPAVRSDDLRLGTHSATSAVEVVQTAWDKSPDEFAVGDIAVSSSGVSVALDGERNMRYILQGTLNLSPVYWIDLATNDVFAPAPVIFDAPVFPAHPAPTNAFFRVLAIPLAEAE